MVAGNPSTTWSNPLAGSGHRPRLSRSRSKRGRSQTSSGERSGSKPPWEERQLEKARRKEHQNGRDMGHSGRTSANLVPLRPGTARWGPPAPVDPRKRGCTPGAEREVRKAYCYQSDQRSSSPDSASESGGMIPPRARDGDGPHERGACDGDDRVGWGQTVRGEPAALASGGNADDHPCPRGASPSPSLPSIPTTATAYIPEPSREASPNSPTPPTPPLMLLPDVGPSDIQALPSQETSASYRSRPRISLSIPVKTTPRVSTGTPVSVSSNKLKTPCPMSPIDQGLDTSPATAAQVAVAGRPFAAWPCTTKKPIPTGPRALRDGPSHIRRPFPTGPTPPMHAPLLAKAPPAPPPATPPIPQAPPLSSPPTTPTTPGFRIDITALSPSVSRGASSVPHAEGQPAAAGGDEEHDEHDPMYMDTDLLYERTPTPMEASTSGESAGGEELRQTPQLMEALTSGELGGGEGSGQRVEGGNDGAGLDLDEARSLFGDEVVDAEEQEDLDIVSDTASEDGEVAVKEDREVIKTEVEESKPVMKLEEDDHENQIMFTMDECPDDCFSGDGYIREAARIAFETQLNMDFATVGKRICMKSWVREGVVFTWEYRATEKGQSVEMKEEREREEVKKEGIEMLGWKEDPEKQDGEGDEQGVWGETRRPEDGMVLGRDLLPTPSPSLAPGSGSLGLAGMGGIGGMVVAEEQRMPTPAESVMREPEQERPAQVEGTCRAGQYALPIADVPPTTPPLLSPPVRPSQPVAPPTSHTASLPAVSTALAPAQHPPQHQDQPLEVVQGRPPKGAPIDKEYRYNVPIPGAYLCKGDARLYNIWRDEQWVKMSALDKHGIPTRHVVFLNDKYSNDKTSFLAVVTPITEQEFHSWPLSMFSDQVDIPIPPNVAAGISSKAVERSIKKWMDDKAEELSKRDKWGRPTKWVVSRKVGGSKLPTARFRWKDISKEWIEKFDGGPPLLLADAQPEKDVQAGDLPSPTSVPKTSGHREERVDKAVFTNKRIARSPSLIPAPIPQARSSRLSAVPPAPTTAHAEPPPTSPVPVVYHDLLDDSASDDDDMGSLEEWAIGSSDDEKVENVKVSCQASVATKPSTKSSVAKAVADTSMPLSAAPTPSAHRSSAPAIVESGSSTSLTKKRQEMDQERDAGRFHAKVQKTAEQEAATGPTVKKIGGGAGSGSGLKLAGKKGSLRTGKAKADVDGLKAKKAWRSSAVLPSTSKVEGAGKSTATAKLQVQGQESTGTKRKNSALVATKPKLKGQVLPAVARRERQRVQSPGLSSSGSDSDSSSDLSTSEDERRPKKRVLAVKPGPRKSGDGVTAGKANAPVKKASRLSTPGPSRAGIPPSPSPNLSKAAAPSADSTSTNKKSLASAKLQRLEDEIKDLLARYKRWSTTAKEATLAPLREEAEDAVKDLESQIWTCQAKYKEEEKSLKRDAD